MLFPTRRPPERGFTLIELLVVIALVAVMAALAAPSFRDFIVRRKLESVASDFQADIMKARTVAMNKNICVTMCRSANAGNTNPTCSAGSDWQPGWIMFINPACDSAANAVPTDPNDPANPSPRLNLIGARVGTEPNIFLQGQVSAPARFMFNPRGIITGNTGLYRSIYISDNNPLTNRYAKDVCVDILSRTRTVPSGTACNAY